MFTYNLYQCKKGKCTQTEYRLQFVTAQLRENLANHPNFQVWLESYKNGDIHLFKCFDRGYWQNLILEQINCINLKDLSQAQNEITELTLTWIVKTAIIDLIEGK